MTLNVRICLLLAHLAALASQYLLKCGKSHVDLSSMLHAHVCYMHSRMLHVLYVNSPMHNNIMHVYVHSNIIIL